MRLALLNRIIEDLTRLRELKQAASKEMPASMRREQRIVNRRPAAQPRRKSPGRESLSRATSSRAKSGKILQFPR